MKLRIKVKRINKTLDLPKVIHKGDWIDLRASRKVTLQGPQAGTLKYHEVNGEKVGHRDVEFDYDKIPLGVAIGLPMGLEAHVLPRSSTFSKFGIMMSNSEGIVDYTYQGDNDEWMFPAVAFRDTTIEMGDRICQFRIQLSQKATLYQKLMWLLSSGIEIVEVEHLGKPNRGGLGSTGIR